MICVEGGGQEAYFKHEDVIAIEQRKPGNPSGFCEGVAAQLTMRAPQCFVYLNEEQWASYRRMIRGNETDAETPVRSNGESTALGYPIGCHSFEKRITLQAEAGDHELVMASCDTNVVADYCAVSIILMDPNNGKQHTTMTMSMDKDFPSMAVLRGGGDDDDLKVLFEMELPKNSEWKKVKK